MAASKSLLRAALAPIPALALLGVAAPSSAAKQPPPAPALAPTSASSQALEPDVGFGPQALVNPGLAGLRAPARRAIEVKMTIPKGFWHALPVATMRQNYRRVLRWLVAPK